MHAAKQPKYTVPKIFINQVLPFFITDFLFKSITACIISAFLKFPQARSSFYFNTHTNTLRSL